MRRTPPSLLEARRAGRTHGSAASASPSRLWRKAATERLIPFDIIPRILSHSEWVKLEAGLKQRVKALNRFIADVYGSVTSLRAGIVPGISSTATPPSAGNGGPSGPHDVWVHIAGIDIVRVDDNDFYVLEDNARTPSVSPHA